MIAHLEGTLRELAPTRIIVDVGGVGYDVHIPLSTFTELPDPGKTVSLHVHTVARDTSLQLFGFHTRAERMAFELLLRASRVGPRLAQTVLSGISPAELFAAIRDGEVRVLRGVPGIGTKMAERMLVELRDRAGELAAELGAEREPVAAAEPAVAFEDDLREQTLSALLNLGTPRASAERAIAGALQELGDGASLETAIRASLQRLAR